MRVRCDVEEIELDGDLPPDDPVSIESLRITCTRCGRSVEIFGQDEDSRKRGGATLRDHCPRGERNFYVVAAP